MNDKIKSLAEQAGLDYFARDAWNGESKDLEKFAELIIQECLDQIETYKIPCGNSPAGEMACEWTYDALKSIRDDIKETFGIEE